MVSAQLRYGTVLCSLQEHCETKAMKRKAMKLLNLTRGPFKDPFLLRAMRRFLRPSTWQRNAAHAFPSTLRFVILDENYLNEKYIHLYC